MAVAKEIRTDPRFARCLEPLAPGVYGIASEPDPGWFHVPLIHGIPEGQGNVGRYLDALPRDKHVVFTVVLSPRLAGMLMRRGFLPATYFLLGVEPVEAWVRGKEVR